MNWVRSVANYFYGTVNGEGYLNAVGSFFQSFLFLAEDGIRDGHVTGVQTCALPISPRFHHPAGLQIELAAPWKRGEVAREAMALRRECQDLHASRNDFLADAVAGDDSDAIGLGHRLRSEERRVGKECGCGRSAAV